ncbi:Uncharacterised protein [uncultured archaeon]|nr:Uncharacterised protein [uncultured archaeon]
MRSIYILIMLVVAASALGCVGNKQAGTSTQAPISPGQTSVSPAETPASVGSAPSGSANQNDLFGTESDLTSVDSLVNDSNMDIPLSDSI